MKRLLLIAATTLVSGAVQAQPPTQSSTPPTQHGNASYFNGGVDGHTTTASGKPVRPDADTAASRTLPLGSTAKVTDQKTGKSANVQITDRGPTRPDRVIDLSKKAAGQIGMQKQGVAPVTVHPEGSH